MIIIFKIFLLFMIILLFYKNNKKCIEIEINYNITKNSNDMPQIGNIFSREKISLDGKWNYIVDVQEVGYYNYRMKPISRGFFLNMKPKTPEDLIEYDFDKAPEMEIPSDWNTKDERLFFYEGTVWFKKSFNYLRKSDKKVILYFGAVNYEAIVFINGKYIGRHEGGFTPFNFDITNTIKNGENFIIVKVNNQRKAENVPTLIFDWWNYGGITRDVYLIEVNNVYIQNYFLYLDKNNTNENEKTIIIKAELNVKKKGKAIEISIPQLNFRQIYMTDEDGKISEIIKVNNLLLWSPENPVLYKIELKLDNEIIKDEIGFRTIETIGKKLLLNGEPIFLRGVCIHDEKPNGGGRTNSPQDARTLLGWAKEMGCNFVRLAHYPHNEYMIREAEKLGIMVWSEIPVYWAISWDNLKTFDNAKSQLTNVINRDKNRANVIIWSIANETPQGYFRDKFLSQLAIYIKSLDNTRLISMAMLLTRNKKSKNTVVDNMNKYIDIISINEYYGWYRRVKYINRLTFSIPYNKPIIISEFGGGAKYGYHGDKNKRWTEEFQENIYIQSVQMLDKIEGLVGTTPWILKDFRSPRRVLNGIQDYYNMKGLVSDKGEKKKSFYVMQNWYKNKQ